MAIRVEFTDAEADTIGAYSPDTYGPLIQDDAGQKFISYVNIIDAQFLDVDVFDLFLKKRNITKDLQPVKDVAHLNLTYRVEDLGTIQQIINTTIPYTFEGDYLDVCTVELTDDPSSVIDSWSITSKTAHEINISVTAHATNVGDAEFSIITPLEDLGVKLIIDVASIPTTTTIIGGPSALWQNQTTNFTGGVGTAEKNVAGSGWNASGDTFTTFKIPLAKDFELTWGIFDLGDTNFSITGLSLVPIGGGHTTDFYIYTHNTTSFQAAENGVNVGGFFGPFAFTDKFMIKAVGTLLTYWRDVGAGYVLFATSPTSRNMDLYVEAQGFTQIRIISLQAEVVI